jgi:hypothetical protein
MSTWKVSNYKQWYYNPEHIHIQLLKSNNSTPNILRDDGNNNLPLKTESVTVTRIDIHPTGEESDQHAIRLTPKCSHVWQPFASLYYVKIGFLLPGWSLDPRTHSLSKNKSTTRIREVRFNIVVTKATRFIGPHKTRHAFNTQFNPLHQGQNDAVLNRHGRELPHRKPRNRHSTLPTLPFRVFPWSPICLARSSNSK